MFVRWVVAGLHVAILSGASAVAEVDLLRSEAAAIDAANAYGFYRGQALTLERVGRAFPRLKADTVLAQNAFDAVFLPALNAIDEALTAIEPDWSEGLDQTIIDNNNLDDLTPSTEVDALAGIETVRARARGEMPSPVLETLLMFTPRYQRDPAAEFRDGFKQSLNVDGTGKAKGVRLKLDLPLSWSSQEGSRPNIIRKFTSENGRGTEIVLLGIFDLGGEVGEADIAEVLNDTGILDMVPDDSHVIDYGDYTLETMPGYWVRFDHGSTRGRVDIAMSWITYGIAYRGKLIQIQAAVGGEAPQKPDELTARFSKFEPLFDQIAQSLVLPDVYSSR